MRVDEVKLTTSQKIKPALQAINKVIPWPIILMTVSSYACGAYLVSLLGLFIADWPIGTFLLKYVLLASIGGVVVFFIEVILYILIFEKIIKGLIDMYDNIMKEYEKTSYKTKEEVLRNSFEDEVLKK